MSETLHQIWLYAQVVLGIGLVIFVHEAGHFVAARLCHVRVETFSLGFGPRLLAWRRGSTTYQLAAVPLGGYVKMAGEDALAEGRAALPDELPSKSVGQRFFIYSGGVLANALFALLVFPVLFSIGVPFPTPILGSPTPGSPAWKAGVVEGSRVISVNGTEVYSFVHVPIEISLGSTDEARMVLVPPGANAPTTVHMKPVYSEFLGAYSIGAQPGSDPEQRIEVLPGSAAERAGLSSGDRLVAVLGVPEGLTLTEQLDFGSRDGNPVRVRVVGASDEGALEKDVLVEPDGSRSKPITLLGIQPAWNLVADVRASALATATGLQQGDRLVAISGQPILRRWDVLCALNASTGPLTLRVLRGDSPITLMGPALGPGEAVKLARDLAIESDGDNTRVVMIPGSAASAAGLLDGDRILSINGTRVKTYENVLDIVRDSNTSDRYELEIERALTDGGVSTLALTVVPAAMQLKGFGFGLRDAQYIFVADGPLDAAMIGVTASWRFVKETWLTLKGILRGRVGGKAVGGIITIGVVSHSFAEGGLVKLLFFLCLLSMNLAFLNVLPIPVLDGGHLFFLLIEKLKGSPVSERVMAYSQMVGIVMIVSLMVYVTFNDVMRWIVN